MVKAKQHGLLCAVVSRRLTEGQAKFEQLTYPARIQGPARSSGDCRSLGTAALLLVSRVSICLDLLSGGPR